MFNIKVLSIVLAGFLLAACGERTSVVTNALPNNNKTVKSMDLSEVIDESDMAKINKYKINKFSLKLKKSSSEICYLYQKSTTCLQSLGDFNAITSFKYTGSDETIALSLINGAWELSYSKGFKDAINADDAKLLMWYSITTIDSKIQTMKNNIAGNRASWKVK